MSVPNTKAEATKWWFDNQDITLEVMNTLPNVQMCFIDFETDNDNENVCVLALYLFDKPLNENLYPKTIRNLPVRLRYYK